MAIGMQQYQTGILPYNSEAEQYHLEADYVGRLNDLNDALTGEPLWLVVKKVNEAKSKGADVSDVKGHTTYYIFNGHQLGLRFYLFDGKITRVTYAFKSQKSAEPEALTTKDVWENPRIKSILKENKSSLDNLVNMLLEK
ncbi:MAG: hypothetical protein QXH80_00930 [Candidatus Nanoarchaeia archaeon]